MKTTEEILENLFHEAVKKDPKSEFALCKLVAIPYADQQVSSEHEQKKYLSDRLEEEKYLREQQEKLMNGILNGYYTALKQQEDKNQCLVELLKEAIAIIQTCIHDRCPINDAVDFVQSYWDRDGKF